MNEPTLIFSPSPHLHTRRTTTGAMKHVLIALVPAVFVALYYFGLPALWVLLVSVATCVATEWFVTSFMLHGPSTIADCSALLTGVLLALNLPANLPLWMVVAGSVMAVGIGKMAFGGLGCNIFNPALVGRVFLLISFPAAMTEWPLPDAGFGDADGATGATILTSIKNGLASTGDYNVADMFVGNIGGSMGEGGSIAILIGFVYLLVMKVIRYDIPMAIFVGVAVFDLLVGGRSIGFDLLSGGLLLGAVFMATDYVTSPMTRKAMWVYGLLIGIITMMIRTWGAYPEGVSFAILVMNGATPLLNRYMRPRVFGLKSKRKEAAA